MTKPIQNDFVEELEYVTPPCPECGAKTEYVNDISRNHGLVKCTKCSWSKILKLYFRDEDWLSLGSYIKPGRLGDWIPYIPGDTRRDGLAGWQLSRPRFKKEDWTLNRQLLFVRDNLGFLADTLVPLVMVLFDTEPYLANKIAKMQPRISDLKQYIKKPEKISPLVQFESAMRKVQYMDLLEAFLPQALLKRDNADPMKMTEEEIKPYLWGYFALLYHWWYLMCEAEIQCTEVLNIPGVRKLWTPLKTSLEAMCSRYDSEVMFHKLAPIALHNRKIKDEAKRNKPKQGTRKRK